MKKLSYFTKKSAVISMLAIAFLLAAVSCTEDEDIAQPIPAGDDIPTVLENFSEELEFFETDESGKKSWRKYRRIPTFRTLIVALIKTDLLRTVARNELTVIAPTDKAFRSIGITPWNVGRVENLEEILLYHVIEGKVFSRDLESGFAPTLNGASVRVSLEDGVSFNDSEVVKADIRALNGVIHIVDAVLIPPTKDIVETALDAPDTFSTLVQAVSQAGLVETLQSEGPFTVFAPTNEAFANAGIDLNTIDPDFLKAVLLYHVVAGKVFSTDLENGFVETVNGASVQISLDGGVFVNTSEVIDPDNQTTNGVIHVINEVLLPPTMDIVGIASGSADFSTLVAAVERAGLAGTLQSSGPFTVFAPTNAAFAAAGITDVNAVPLDVLTNVLLYHVVPGKAFSTDLESRDYATALAGESVTITLNGGVQVDGINVIGANVQATNGVIHVIEGVLFP